MVSSEYRGGPFVTWLLLTATTALLQITLGFKLASLGVRLDPVMVMVLCWSLVRGAEEGVVVGILGGLALDFFSPTPFGINVVALGLVGFATGLGEYNLFRGTLALPVVTAAAATVGYHLILLLGLQAVGWEAPWPATILVTTGPSVIINSVLAGVLFWPARRLGRAAAYVPGS